MEIREFEKQIEEATGGTLQSQTIDTIQVNLGLKCNQACKHCHLDASPKRNEAMDWPVMELVLEAAKSTGARLMDLTGGAPELNPHFRRFIGALKEQGHDVQVRTNLTVLFEADMETLPEFFRNHRVKLVGSMPCYLQENVCAQRGEGVYEKSIQAVRRLNELGYGKDSELQLNLVYNPGGPALPPDQVALEVDYKRELGERFGITFTNLITIINMPIGRFRLELQKQNQEAAYMELLMESFNPKTVENLMCRRQISVSWDGTLYDCDFNLALGMPVNHGAPSHLKNFDFLPIRERQIVVGEHCFGCTAGAGSSCAGSLL